MKRSAHLAIEQPGEADQPSARLASPLDLSHACSRCSVALIRNFLVAVVVFAAASKSHAQTATIDSVGCGTGCVQTITQLSPVSRTSGGYPRVLVIHKTVLSPAPGQNPVRYDRAGDPIVQWRGIAYPRAEKSWIIADCTNKRVSLYAKNSDGLDAGWSNAYNEMGEPNNCHSACGRAYDQWYLLCKAAGEI